MNISPEVRNQIMIQAHGAMALYAAFVGVVDPLSGMFEQQILPNVPVYSEANKKSGVAVNLGCGNGWYLRQMAKRLPQLCGVGLDGFAENITQATQLARQEGLGDRLTFQVGDIHPERRRKWVKKSGEFSSLRKDH
jgi:SAM-dependent methyltransferase